MPVKKFIKFSNNTSFRIALPAITTILLFVIVIFFIFLPHIEKSFVLRKKEMIKELTETVWSLVESYRERELSGELSTDEAKLRAVLRIGKLRYGPELKDCFWITDTTPRIILHPYHPDIQNKKIADIEDEQIKNLFLKFNQVVKEKGFGYIDYHWQWKDQPGKISPKTSYTKIFEPWGWIVGTGMYTNDIYSEINAIRNKFLAVSIGILGLVLSLSLYSIRQTMKMDRELIKTFFERQKLMESLKESKERFRSLLETTSDWIWESDEKGRFTYSSPRAEDLFGLPSDETKGKTIIDFVPLVLKSVYKEPYEELISLQKPFKGFEVTCLGKNWQNIVLEINAVPVFSEKGEILGYRGVTRDISVRKMAMEALKKSRDRLHSNLEETVKSLVAAEEKRDPYTAGHQERVDKLACAIARELGLPEKQIEGLHFAALLHDIGKIALPSEFLSKPTLLSSQEQEIIKCHAEIGYDILKNINFPWPVAEIVYQHHELLDGSGYPRGLKDEEILLEAKILTVADVVEAMSSHRPYRPSLGVEASLNQIRKGRGVKYHGPSVDACLKLILEKGFDLVGEKHVDLHS